MSQSASHETVMDVGAEQLGKTYARALLGACQSDGSVEPVMEQLQQVCDDYLAQSSPLAAAFESPRVSVSEKSRVIDRVFGDWGHPNLIRFMKVMASRERLGYLRSVRRAAEALHDDAMGRVVAEVQTAVPMDDSLRNDVVSQLSGRLGKSVRLRESVDPDIIGGMIIRVGDTVFDSSVSGRIAKIGRAASAGFATQLVQQASRFGSDE
ncbi:MAG: ATP synthase F1 subunit delta [Planctomycetota bacterium]